MSAYLLADLSREALCRINKPKGNSYFDLSGFGIARRKAVGLELPECSSPESGLIPDGADRLSMDAGQAAINRASRRAPRFLESPPGDRSAKSLRY